MRGATHLVVVKTSPPQFRESTTSGSACGGGDGGRVCGSCAMLLAVACSAVEVDASLICDVRSAVLRRGCVEGGW
jgi:hypothetical protein